MAKRRPEALPDADHCTRSRKSNRRCSLPPPPRQVLLPQAPPRPPQVQEIHRHQTLAPGPPRDMGIPSNTESRSPLSSPPPPPPPSPPSPSRSRPSPTECSSSPTERMVEVVSSFCDESGAVAAAMLAEDEEGVGACRRQLHDGCELFRRFAREELFAFSHRVPDDVQIGICVLEKKKRRTRLSWITKRLLVGNQKIIEGSSMEEQSLDPTDNRENVPTLDDISYLKGTIFFHEMPLRSTEGIDIMDGSYQQPESCSVNANVSEEESGRLIENQGGDAPNTDTSVLHEIIARNRGQTIEDIDAESARIAGEAVSSEGDSTSTCEQPVKLFGFDYIEMERTFELGEVWALYDEYNGLPQAYASY